MQIAFQQYGPECDTALAGSQHCFTAIKQDVASTDQKYEVRKSRQRNACNALQKTVKNDKYRNKQKHSEDVEKIVSEGNAFQNYLGCTCLFLMHALLCQARPWKATERTDGEEIQIIIFPCLTSFR